MLGLLLPTKLLKALWPRVEGEGETLLSALPTLALGSREYKHNSASGL